MDALVPDGPDHERAGLEKRVPKSVKASRHIADPALRHCSDPSHRRLNQPRQPSLLAAERVPYRIVVTGKMRSRYGMACSLILVLGTVSYAQDEDAFSVGSIPDNIGWNGHQLAQFIASGPSAIGKVA